jgi:hypothetical protein
VVTVLAACYVLWHFVEVRMLALGLHPTAATPFTSHHRHELPSIAG